MAVRWRGAACLPHSMFFAEFTPEQRERRSILPFLPQGLVPEELAGMLPDLNVDPPIEPKGPHGETLISVSSSQVCTLLIA